MTFPSILKHLNPSRRWIIFIDAKMNQGYLRRLHELVDSHDASQLISIQPVLVYAEVPVTLKALLRHHETVRLIRMDDDDAISKDYFEHIPDEPGIHTLALGYEADLLRQQIRPIRKPSLSLNTVFHGSSALVESFSRTGHHVIRQWADKNHVPYVEIANHNRAFIYSRHKQSDSNFTAVRKSIAEDPRRRTFIRTLQKRFGIDDEQYLAWRRFTRKAPTTGSRKTWALNTELNNIAAQKITELASLGETMRENTANLFET